MEEVRKRGNQIKDGDKKYKLSDLVNSKKEKLEEIKNAFYHDLKNLVYKSELTYDKFMNLLDIKFFP